MKKIRAGRRKYDEGSVGDTAVVLNRSGKKIGTMGSKNAFVKCRKGIMKLVYFNPLTVQFINGTGEN